MKLRCKLHPHILRIIEKFKSQLCREFLLSMNEIYFLLAVEYFVKRRENFASVFFLLLLARTENCLPEKVLWTGYAERSRNRLPTKFLFENIEGNIFLSNTQINFFSRNYISLDVAANTSFFYRNTFTIFIYFFTYFCHTLFILFIKSSIVI